MPTHKCCTFSRIHCLDPKSNTNGDDIYIKVSIDGGREVRYPDKGTFVDGMQAGDWTPYLNIPFEFNETLFIELLEHDPIGDDDYLGSVTFTPSNLAPLTPVIGSESAYDFELTDIRDC